MAPFDGPNGSAASSYMGHTKTDVAQDDHFTPVGALVFCLIQRLAWENAFLRGLADYYRVAKLAGSGRGQMRMWPSSMYSDDIRSQVEAGALASGMVWDEWQMAFW